MERIYLDNNATTLIDPRVAQTLIKELSFPPSNPSAQHTPGQLARGRLVSAREKVASYCGAKQNEIIFTSGGTEGMNLLIRGLAPKGKKILSSTIEHAATQNTLLDLQKKGHDVLFLSPTPAFIPSFANIEEKLEKGDVGLLVFSAVNSETGSKIPLEELASLAEKWSVPLVIDGVALLGKEPLFIPKGVSGMAFSAHKCHGPKGIGFVFLRKGLSISPEITGGGQEFGLRSGTENLPGIVALARLIEILEEETEENQKRISALRDLFEKKLCAAYKDIQINGGPSRICNVSNLSFVGIDAETLLIQLDLQGIAASQGSACSSGALEPSKVLKNSGLPNEVVRSALRFSLSKYTTEEEIERAVSLITAVVAVLK